jgi:hypothetical protein
VLGIRLAIPASLVLALAIGACLTHPIFGSGPTYSFSGTPNTAPMHDLVPGADDPNAAQPMFLHRSLDAGVDSRSTNGD